MHPLDDGLPMEDRISPTTEDVAILQRNIRRIMAWDHALHPPGPHGEIVGSNLLHALRLACGDYIHFKPKELRRTKRRA